MPADLTANLPGLLLVGAPKSGTTTLAAWWDEHPQGFTAPGKEVGFFTVEWARGLDWYAEQFAGARAGQVTCDASPGYMYDEVALGRIAQVLPAARVALILREPVSRVWSHWCYMVALGLEPRSFERVLDEETRDEDITPPRFPIGYLRGSRYARALGDVLRHVDEDRVLVLFTDDLAADPAAAFARLCAHAGVEPGVPGTSRNEGRFPRWPRAQRLLHQARAPRWPRGVGTRLMLANVRPGPPPALSREHRARLEQLLRPELDALEGVLGRPVPAAWRRQR